MAINLWAAAGKPTAYSPLPLGFNQITVPTVGTDVVVKFKAKSASEASIDTWASTEAGTSRRTKLTKEFKDYTFNIKTLISNGLVILYDSFQIGDIIIENITLVEKPIPPIRKPKKNLLPPFSQWSLHANAKVVAPYELELDATANYQVTRLKVPTSPNTQYVLKFEGNGYVKVNSYKKDGTAIVTLVNWLTGTNTFTTSSDTDYVEVWFGNTTTLNKFTFKNPMLTEGTTAQPFEPFVPVNARAVKGAKKNLFSVKEYDAKKVFGVASSYSVIYSLKPNTNYTLSTNMPYTQSDSANLYFGGTTGAVNGTKFGAPRTMITPSNGQIEIAIRNEFTTSGASDAYQKLLSGEYWIQLEEGATATPFEPYREVNKRAGGLVGKKNLLSLNESVVNGVADPKIQDFTENLKQGGAYTLSGTFAIFPSDDTTNERVTISFFYSDGSIVSYDNGINNQIRDGVERKIVVKGSANPAKTLVKLRVVPFNYSTTGTKMHRSFKELQLEINENATPYEPYKPINPPAPKGIIMDGVTNYVQLPSMTMDSIEIDCLVDSVQLKSPAKIIDARTGLSNGWAQYAGSIQAGSGWPTITGFKVAERTKMKFFAISVFTDNVTIFSNEAGNNDFTKGILYGVKCYLNGKVVAEYDFTTENTKAMNVVMGTKTWRNKLAKR